MFWSRSLFRLLLLLYYIIIIISADITGTLWLPPQMRRRIKSKIILLNWHQSPEYPSAHWHWLTPTHFPPFRHRVHASKIQIFNNHVWNNRGCMPLKIETFQNYDLFCFKSGVSLYSKLKHLKIMYFKAVFFILLLGVKNLKCIWKKCAFSFTVAPSSDIRKLYKCIITCQK